MFPSPRNTTISVLNLLTALTVMTGLLFGSLEAAGTAKKKRDSVNCVQCYKDCIVGDHCPKERPLKCGPFGECHSFDSYCNEKSEAKETCFPRLSSQTDQLEFCKANKQIYPHHACLYACLHRFPQLQQTEPTEESCKTWSWAFGCAVAFLVLSIILHVYIFSKYPQTKEVLPGFMSGCLSKPDDGGKKDDDDGKKGDDDGKKDDPNPGSGDKKASGTEEPVKDKKAGTSFTHQKKAQISAQVHHSHDNPEPESGDVGDSDCSDSPGNETTHMIPDRDNRNTGGSGAAGGSGTTVCTDALKVRG